MIIKSPQTTTLYSSTGREQSNLASAFGEQLVGQLSPQLQNSFEYTVLNTDLNTTAVAGSGTMVQANAMAVASTGTTTASTALFKTTHHAKYRPGLGGVLRCSGMFSTPVAGTFQYIGLMDEPGATAEFKNGYAIGYHGTTFTIARFQNDVLFEVVSTAFDDQVITGSGASGVTLNPLKLNVFYIQYQYLGAGAINFWMEHPVTGIPFIFHTLEYANANTTPSTYNPNYHFQLYVDNGATTSNVSVSCGSYMYAIEGKTNLIEQYQPQNSSGSKSKATVTTEVAIFTIKNKTTYPTALSKTNYIDILLERFGCSIEASSANNLGTVRLVRNATLGGVPSYADISASNSVISIDVAGTTVTGGTELLSIELAGKNDKAGENILPYVFIIHPGDTITLAGSSANSATIKASLLWKELF
jgi:hypothetical protein